jgi:uncharacterized protein (DUF302 family)
MAIIEITHCPYGNAVTVPLPFAETVARTKQALKDEGFGVLCEIDVAKTFKEKIDTDFRPYSILGACNPRLAHRALSAEDDLGLLLPCNLVVAADERGGTRVSAIDAAAMMRLVGNVLLDPIASEVNERLGRVLQNVADMGTGVPSRG